MRIGIDARFFGGEQSKGLGRYTQKLVEHLLEIDSKNQYVLFVQEETLRELKSVEHTHQSSNVTYVEAPYRWYTLAEQLFMPIKIAQHKVDLMHFPHFNVPLFYNGPFVVTIHDLIISRFPTSRATTLGSTSYKIKQLAYNRVMNHAVRKAQRIITVSNYSKQDITDYFGISADHISVTYEAVDQFMLDTQSAQSDKDILNQYAISKPYVLYVGNAYPHKNLEILLQVMAELKKSGQLTFQLVLVGKEDYFYLRLQQEAWAKDVEDVMVFPGFIPDRHLPAVYQNALAYIFPSQLEGFGLPPLEAMQYGTPVISSKSSCLPEVLGDAALYFEYQDINGIINQIKRLQEDDRLRDRLVVAGYNQVKKYSWRQMAQQTLKIYQDVFTKSQT